MLGTKRFILKTIVGSQAHGLATPESDFDYRGVFIYPTSEIISIRPPSDQTSWIEGKKDDTSWELGKFLMMAIKCNPTILEVFKSPVNYDFKYGQELRDLFPYVWNSTDVCNAYIGYGLNQRKKFLEDKDKRQPKYAVAYLRSLYNAWEILTTGDFSVDMSKTEIFKTLKKWKSGDFTLGGVINLTNAWQAKVEGAYKDNPNKKTEIEPINDFLLKVRKENWI
jgi:hypothetical protein